MSTYVMRGMGRGERSGLALAAAGTVPVLPRTVGRPRHTDPAQSRGFLAFTLGWIWG